MRLMAGVWHPLERCRCRCRCRAAHPPARPQLTRAADCTIAADRARLGLCFVDCPASTVVVRPGWPASTILSCVQDNCRPPARPCVACESMLRPSSHSQRCRDLPSLRRFAQRRTDRLIEFPRPSACGPAGSRPRRGHRRSPSRRYQEDAQAAYRAGASQLDGDKDGIACESLPHRPSPSPAPTPTPTSSAVGLWRGMTSTNRTVTGLVFSNGSYYVFYSKAAAPSIIGGVVQGTGSTLGASFASSNAKDFNNEGLGVVAATVSASIQTKVSLNGSISYASGQSTTFTSAYGIQFETTPTLSAVAGTYTGQAGLASGLQTMVISVSATGAISSSSNGCSTTGTSTARSDANAYDVVLTFGPAPCTFAGQTVLGLAYFDAGTKRLYAATPNTARTAALVFFGTKP